VTAVAEIHKLDDDFEVQRLARLLVEPDGVRVVQLAPGGAGIADALLSESLVDPFGRTVSAPDGADFLKTLRWARSSDFLWVTPLADLPAEEARDPAAALPAFPEWGAPATVPYPEPPPALDAVRVAEVRWPAPDDYLRTEVVARLVDERPGPVRVEAVQGPASERAILEAAIAGRSLDDLVGAVVAPGMVVVPAPFDQPGDKAWRDALVRARAEAVERGDTATVERLDLEFVTRLPRIWLSRCPFTGEVLRRAIDPYGFDGPYWSADAPVRPLDDELPATFVGLAGAVTGPIAGEVPAAAVGPARPPLFPQVLEDHGIRAVLSATQVGQHRCDLVAYFAQPGSAGSARIREWGTRFVRTRRGTTWSWAPAVGADPSVAPDLRTWIASDRVSWIAPFDVGVQLRTGVSGCPWIVEA